MPALTHHDDKRIRQLSEQWIWHSRGQFDRALIILASVNVAATCLMIACIIVDAHNLARSRPLHRKLHLHPAEVFPLVISVAIVIQGAFSISIKAMLNDTPTMHCETMSQFLWPTLWIVPYTMLVFGLETATRSLHNERFQHQRRRNVLCCVIAVIIMILVTWVPSFVYPIQGECLSSLVWWTARFAKLGLVIGSGVLLTYVISSVVITTRLLRATTLDRSQRIDATRIVYHLIVSVIIMALVIPFFILKTMRRDRLVAFQIAEVALNLLGIINLLLHIFLRSNADRAAIRPMESTCSRKRPLRVFGSRDLETTMHNTSPLPLEKEVEHRHDSENDKLATDPHAACANRAKCLSSSDTEVGISSPQGHNGINDQEYRCLVWTDKVSRVGVTSWPHHKGSNYSIFPTFSSAMLRNSMSTTFSQDYAESLQPPKPVLPSLHTRDISEHSSATVQIGFRLSALNATQQRPTFPSPAASAVRLSIHSTSGSLADSPPISPMSTRLNVPSTASQEATNLPIQTNATTDNERLCRSIMNYFIPDRVGRRPSHSRSQLDQRQRMTMKALPPNPPIDSNLRLSDL
ncbi:MAG: hypothetical protein Q9181_004819 [Wetmoreana brouardii]